MNEIPNTCKECPHIIQTRRRFGYTIHCTIDSSKMDVTHVVGRSLLCPLNNKKVTNSNKK